MRRSGYRTARHAGRAALIVALALVGQPAARAGTGPEWRALTAGKAWIVFQAPGLENQRVRYLRGTTDNHSSTMEYATWTGPAAHHAKAIVVYNKLSPGYHYRTRDDPERIIESFETFEDKKLEFGSRQTAGNSIGRIEFRRFGFEDVRCVGFAEYWRALPGATISIGSRLIYGYYCADPGEPLSDNTVMAVVKGLDLKAVSAQIAETEVAVLTPPVKSRQEVEAYLDQNKKKIENRLSAYNWKHRVLVGNNTVLDVERIHSIRIRRLSGESVFAKVSFTLGRRGSPWTAGAGTFLFELKWIGGDLEFVGHQKGRL